MIRPAVDDITCAPTLSEYFISCDLFIGRLFEYAVSKSRSFHIFNETIIYTKTEPDTWKSIITPM